MRRTAGAPITRSRFRLRTPLADYPVVIEIPVAWGEMDAYGHVNNIVCFDYRENRKAPFSAELKRKISELENSVAPVKLRSGFK